MALSFRGLLARAPVGTAPRTSRRAIVVRAETDKPVEAASPVEAAPVSAAQPAVAAAAPAAAPSMPAAAPASFGYKAPEPVSFGDSMAFSGAPEIINGRLCMLAMVSALAAEVSSHESVLAQFSDASTPVLVATGLITAGSLVTYMNGSFKKGESFGAFSPMAELINARMAMVGLAGLLICEAVNGGAALF